MDAPSFFRLLRTPKKFKQDLLSRLDHIEALVKRALIDLGVTDPEVALVQQRTWELRAPDRPDAAPRVAR